MPGTGSSSGSDCNRRCASSHSSIDNVVSWPGRAPAEIGSGVHRRIRSMSRGRERPWRVGFTDLPRSSGRAESARLQPARRGFLVLPARLLLLGKAALFGLVDREALLLFE